MIGILVLGLTVFVAVLVVTTLLVTVIVSPLLACIAFRIWQEWEEEASKNPAERSAPRPHACKTASQPVKS